MKITEKLQTDVLVIGGGAAGLRAALAAAESGSQVIVTNKGPLTKSGITLTAAGGMQAPFHPADSEEQYFKDTIQCGYGLGDQNLAKVLAADACSRILDLERYGTRFVRDTEGHFSLGQFPGQSQPRNLFVKGGGLGLVSSLAKACQAHTNILIIDDFFVSGLITGQSSQENVAVGAIGINLRNGQLALIQAKAVVMATGGCQWLWEINDCPTDATGEGLVYAYRAGADLIDMEMVLFYPSVIVWPPSVKGAFAHYEFLAADILDGNIYDRNANSVLPKPLPIRNEAMQLMARAINDGRGSEHGGLFWYVGNSPNGLERVRETLNIAQYNYIKSHGIDPATDKIEVAPGAHYLLGGIHINEQCQTTVNGLFATPECAGNFDGANRLAGSGITATQVFGAKAGFAAHQWAVANQYIDANPASIEQETWRIAGKISTTNNHQGTAISELRNRLRTAVQSYAGVNRNGEGLARLTKIAKEIREELSQLQVPEVTVYNQQLIDLLQLESMCEVAMLVAECALMRQESRGHHYRTDFPCQDDQNWLKHTLAVSMGIEPRFATKPINVLSE